MKVRSSGLTPTPARVHQPSDELTDEWTFEGMAADAEFVFQVGLSVANAAAMPTWNRGDEFEATGLKAVEASE
jgi:hypothetical protein